MDRYRVVPFESCDTTCIRDKIRVCRVFRNITCENSRESHKTRSMSAQQNRLGLCGIFVQSLNEVGKDICTPRIQLLYGLASWVGSEDRLVVRIDAGIEILQLTGRCGTRIVCSVQPIPFSQARLRNYFKTE